MKPLFCKYYPGQVDFGQSLGFAYESLVNGPFKFDAYATWAKLSERVSQGIYMGEGLLLPHTRISALPEPLMTFAVAPAGFTGISVARKETPKFMCVLLSPAESATAHTQTIAKLASLLLNKDWKDRALSCKDDSDVFALFEE